MAANQVGHRGPPAAQTVWSRAALQAASCLGPCSRGAPGSQNQPLCTSCVRAGAGWAALLQALPPAAWGLLPCAPAFQGLWLVAAAWHVLLRPRSPGQAAAMRSHLTPSASHGVLTGPTAAPCPFTSSPPLLTHVLALSCLSRGCLGLPPPRPAVVLVPAAVLATCASPASVRVTAVPWMASGCKAVWVMPPSLVPFQTYYQTPPPIFSFRQRAFHKSVVYLWVLCR